MTLINSLNPSIPPVCDRNDAEPENRLRTF